VDWVYLAKDTDRWRAREHNNEPSGSVKGGELVYYLMDY
jgi:hypothetical protein